MQFYLLRIDHRPSVVVAVVVTVGRRRADVHLSTGHGVEWRRPTERKQYYRSTTAATLDRFVSFRRAPHDARCTIIILRAATTTMRTLNN